MHQRTGCLAPPGRRPSYALQGPGFLQMPLHHSRASPTLLGLGLGFPCTSGPWTRADAFASFMRALGSWTLMAAALLMRTSASSASLLGALHLRVLDPCFSTAHAHALGIACCSGAGLRTVGCTNGLGALHLRALGPCTHFRVLDPCRCLCTARAPFANLAVGCTNEHTGQVDQADFFRPS
jgi:hypothetical protein